MNEDTRVKRTLGQVAMVFSFGSIQGDGRRGPGFVRRLRPATREPFYESSKKALVRNGRYYAGT
jgi:hypothetical protein